MKGKQIINIVNFIRAVEPRVQMDLVEPVREQIRLMKEHGLRGTFLLQYDALIDPAYIDLLKPLDPAQFEMGLWFETVQPLVEGAGIAWRGRYPWDWHAHCGFSVGYTKPQKEAMIDLFYTRFQEVFGYYPRVFGSWFFDSPTARYVADRYGCDAFCNCKEQYGTDGYTLWGGYYGQAYYPSRKNVFLPAVRSDDQLNVPLFRMLGSDPVCQYDFGLSAEVGTPRRQGVITLEPVYRSAGGGNPAWVDWYLKENFNGDCLSFGYAQAGQENSFGWEAMADGLCDQFARFAHLQAEGKLTVEPLGDSGRRYKQSYAVTPASTIVARSAWDDPQKHSVWYSSRFYRVNLYGDPAGLRIRDLHLFTPTLEDPFEDHLCESNEAVYESLPVIDGNRHSGGGILAGGYFTHPDGTPITASAPTFADLGDDTARLGYGDLQITLAEGALTVVSPREFALSVAIGRADHLPTVLSCTDRALTLAYESVIYTLTLQKGRFASPTALRSEDGVLEVVVTDSGRGRAPAPLFASDRGSAPAPLFAFDRGSAPAPRQEPS